LWLPLKILVFSPPQGTDSCTPRVSGLIGHSNTFFSSSIKLSPWTLSYLHRRLVVPDAVKNLRSWSVWVCAYNQLLRFPLPCSRCHSLSVGQLKHFPDVGHAFSSRRLQSGAKERSVTPLSVCRPGQIPAPFFTRCSKCRSRRPMIKIDILAAVPVRTLWFQDLSAASQILS